MPSRKYRTTILALVATAAVMAGAGPAVAKAHARHHRTRHQAKLIVCDKQGCRPEVTPVDAHRARPARRRAHRTAMGSRQSRKTAVRGFRGQMDMTATPRGTRRRIGVVAHPSGCPWRLFCGCGVAAKVFGPGVRFVIYERHRLNLWLAADWLHFPRTIPAPGMVAARRGHVFYIEKVYRDGTVTAYDPNSGGHLTRVHRIKLRGYHVVDPSLGRVASMD